MQNVKHWPRHWKNGYFECPTWHTYKDPKSRGWVDALLFCGKWTVLKISQPECQMWIVRSFLYFMIVIMLCELWSFWIISEHLIYSSAFQLIKHFAKAHQVLHLVRHGLTKTEFNFRHCTKWRAHIEGVGAEQQWEKEEDESYTKDPAVIILLAV